MPTLAIDGFNIVCATLGGFIAAFGLVSFLFKEKFYLSETLISLVAGVIFSPHGANLIRPLEYALGNEDTLGLITLYFARLVLGIQLVIAGVQLPNMYLRREWRSLALLLGPGMIAMWLSSSLLIWALVPNFQFVYALAVGACITPTDPVLANNIVKGKFADKNIPKDLQHIIIAESGANDGLGYPFLFLPLYLIKFVVEGGKGSSGGAGAAIGNWVVETFIYQIVLGTAYGAVVGWIASKLIRWAEERKYVDRESFLVFALALALFIVGTAGMIGSDDVLASFVAGNVFTWDDYYRKETEDDSIQPTIDMLLTVSIFLWIGAVCPWQMFAVNSVIPIYRLIFLGILVLLFRRPPVVFAMHKQIRQIEEWRQAAFVGYFGPIGISGVFYLYVALDWLAVNVTWDGSEREDAAKLGEVLNVVVWFMVICSVIVHGLSIPLGKLGFYLPRTFSRAVSMDARYYSRENLPSLSPLDLRLPTRKSSPKSPSIPGRLLQAGRGIFNSVRGGSSRDNSAFTSSRTTRGHTPGNVSPTVVIGAGISIPSESVVYRQNPSQPPRSADKIRTISPDGHVGLGSSRNGAQGTKTPEHGLPFSRSIRFPDDDIRSSSPSSAVDAVALDEMKNQDTAMATQNEETVTAAENKDTVTATSE